VIYGVLFLLVRAVVPGVQMSGFRTVALASLCVALVTLLFNVLINWGLQFLRRKGMF
jgi:hypothetical protein